MRVTMFCQESVDRFSEISMKIVFPAGTRFQLICTSENFQNVSVRISEMDKSSTQDEKIWLKKLSTQSFIESTHRLCGYRLGNR